MAPIQTKPKPAQDHDPSTVLSSRFSKPPARSTRTSNPLLSHAPQIPEDPFINLPLLRNKLLLACRPYIPSYLLHPALADGIYSRATHWLTPSSLSASRHGRRKRYFILHTHDFSLSPVDSAWDACEANGSQPIDAGNGVVMFVRERDEWEAFMRRYKRMGRRAGELARERSREVERGWRERWKEECGVQGGEGRGKGKGREGDAGPMWVLVKGAVGRICKGEA